MKCLDELFEDDLGGEEKKRFVHGLTDYVEGRGESLHKQAYFTAKNYNLALEAYDEDQDPDVDPPVKTNEVAILFVLEKMMHQADMLDASSIPTCTNISDAYAQRYTIQDLVLVITLLSISVVKNKALIMPSYPKESKAKTVKAARQVELKEKSDKVSEHRDLSKDKLAKTQYVKELYDEVEDRVMGDYTNFYMALNKKSKSDNGKMMSVFTQSRVDAFAKWKGLGIGKGKKRGGGEIVDLTSKEKKRKKCEDIMNGIYDTEKGSDNEDDDDNDESEDGWV